MGVRHTWIASSIAASLALAFVLLALAGGAGAASPARPAGDLRIVLTNLWNEALDPMLAQSLGRRGLIALYDPLVGGKPDGSDYDRETGIARAWEMSPDGKTWTFHLRKGIQFHRGFGELTAEDVKFSLERLKSERSMAARKGYFKQHVGKIEVVDRYTVRVHSTGAPIPDFLPLMSVLYDSIEQLIVSKRAVETLGEQGFATNPVGSGPYRFVEHVGGQSIKLEAVENHWRVGTPRFKHLHLLAVPEEETALAMLARGDADLVPISRSSIKRVKAKGLTVVVQKNMGGMWLWLSDQFIPGTVGHNARVREALNLAIDRQAIVNSIFEGIGRPYGTFNTTSIPLEQMGYNWRQDLYPYDPERARRLLADAGYPNGFDIDLYSYPYAEVPEGPEVMQAVAAMWRKIGVRARLVTADFGVVRSKMLKHTIPGSVGYFPLRTRPWQGMVGFYRQFMHSTGIATFIKSAEMDRLLDTASQSLDPKAAKAALLEATRYIRQHHHAIAIVEFDLAYGVSKKVANWNPGFLEANLNLDSLVKGQ